MIARAESQGSDVEWCPTCERTTIGVETAPGDDHQPFGDSPGLRCSSCGTAVEECERWAELELHEDGPGYLLVILGQSSVPGETTRRTEHRVATRADLVSRLRIRGRLTKAARELLAAAGLAMEV